MEIPLVFLLNKTLPKLVKSVTSFTNVTCNNESSVFNHNISNKFQFHDAEIQFIMDYESFYYDITRYNNTNDEIITIFNTIIELEKENKFSYFKNQKKVTIESSFDRYCIDLSSNPCINFDIISDQIFRIQIEEIFTANITNNHDIAYFQNKNKRNILQFGVFGVTFNVRTSKPEFSFFTDSKTVSVNIYCDTSGGDVEFHYGFEGTQLQTISYSQPPYKLVVRDLTLTVENVDSNMFDGQNHKFIIYYQRPNGAKSATFEKDILLLKHPEFKFIATQKEYLHKRDTHLILKLDFKQLDSYIREYAITISNFKGIKRYDFVPTGTDIYDINIPFPSEQILREDKNELTININNRDYEENYQFPIEIIYKYSIFNLTISKAHYYRDADKSLIIQGNVIDHTNKKLTLSYQIDEKNQHNFNIEMKKGKAQVNQHVNFGDDLVSGEHSIKLYSNKEKKIISTLNFNYIDITLDFIVSDFVQQGSNRYKLSGNVTYNHPGDNITITARVIGTDDNENIIMNEVYHEIIHIDKIIDIQIPFGNRTIIFKASSPYINKTVQKSYFIAGATDLPIPYLLEGTRKRGVLIPKHPQKRVMRGVS